MTDYFGNTTDYTYNGRGAVTSISELYHGTSTPKTTTYSYNDDGSLAQVNIPNRNMKTYADKGTVSVKGLHKTRSCILCTGKAW